MYSTNIGLVSTLEEFMLLMALMFKLLLKQYLNSFFTVIEHKWMFKCLYMFGWCQIEIEPMY